MYQLAGVWNATIDDGKIYQMKIPGSLDENKIGHKDTGANQWHPDSALGNATEGFDKDAPISTRFTRRYTYEGEARIYKRVSYIPEVGKRVFVHVERARCLRLLIDGEEIDDFVPPSISTPHIFEITGRLNGDNEICFLSDNSYPGLPHDDIVYSSAATDETQTNWNGLLGDTYIYEKEPIFIENIFVYPNGNTIDVVVEIDSEREFSGQITLSSQALTNDVHQEFAVQGQAGKTRLEIKGLPLVPDVKRWDEYEGHLYEMTVDFNGAREGKSTEQVITDIKKVKFGVRDFGDDGTGRLALNNRRIFIRSEANCGEFPESGYAPTDVESWRDILGRFKAYGVNLMRFHSHCPVEAAFTAADELGILMQPELSQWNPKNALETPESVVYYTRELQQIIRMLANHPSFVMFTLGNELQNGEEGIANMNRLLEIARGMDTTRLFANGSNTHYGERGCDPNSDFAQSQRYFGADLRGIFASCEGFINDEYPNARHTYDDSMAILRKDYKKPVYSFEVGQFEVLPDFDELEDFKGISDPVNYKLILEKVEKAGLLPVWKKYVEATGELSLLGYRAEIEAAMRTKELSGISLLGLQDFPGQGTALVGMMNSHLNAKPFSFADPKRFAKFFTDVLPMVYLPKYTYEVGEWLEADVMVANYSKADIEGELICKLDGAVVLDLQSAKASTGDISYLGTIKVLLDAITCATQMKISVKLGEHEREYSIWVYPKVTPVCPPDVYESRILDARVREVLERGGRVFLAPDATKEAMPNSIGTQFTTDFWSVGTFAMQEGSMGQLIDEKHPIFRDFPTSFHTDYQWWPMAGTRALILPRQLQCIITEMDSYAYLRPMAQLFECKVGAGRLLVSSMGLHDLQQYPEARALLNAIYNYMNSDEFNPEQELDIEELQL